MSSIKHEQHYKTTAMIEDALRDHHRKLFWIDVKFWCGIAAVAAVVFMGVFS